MKPILSVLIVYSLTIPSYASNLSTLLDPSTNPAQIIEQIVCPTGQFDFEKTRSFFLQMKRDLEIEYGIDIDLQVATELALKTLVESNQFTEEEISSARELYAQLIRPDTHMRFANKTRAKKSSPKEFTLPDKTATGFVMILGGALLCIIPTGITQGLGVTLVGSGIYTVIDGAREGERPYYANPENPPYPR